MVVLPRSPTEKRIHYTILRPTNGKYDDTDYAERLKNGWVVLKRKLVMVPDKMNDAATMRHS